MFQAAFEVWNLTEKRAARFSENDGVLFCLRRKIDRVRTVKVDTETCALLGAISGTIISSSH